MASYLLSAFSFSTSSAFSSFLGGLSSRLIGPVIPRQIEKETRQTATVHTTLPRQASGVSKQSGQMGANWPLFVLFCGWLPARENKLGLLLTTRPFSSPFSPSLPPLPGARRVCSLTREIASSSTLPSPGESCFLNFPLLNRENSQIYPIFFKKTTNSANLNVFPLLFVVFQPQPASKLDFLNETTQILKFMSVSTDFPCVFQISSCFLN